MAKRAAALDPAFQLLGAPVCLAPDGRKQALGPGDALLVALLALDGPRSRGEVMRLLSPGAPSSETRNALRQRLSRMRRAWGDGVIEGSELLQLGPRVRHDLRGARSEASDSAPVMDDLLSTVVPQPPTARDWLAEARQRVRTWQREALAQYIRSRMALGQHEAALSAAVPQLQRDPLDELLCADVMRLQLLCTGPAEALRTYDALRTRLRRELRSEPTPALRQMAADLRLGLSSRPVQPFVAPSGRVEAPPVALLRPPLMVGRSAISTQLQHGLVKKGVDVIRGEPGVGKTRLLEELGRQIAAHRTAAEPGDALVPFSLLTRLLRLLVKPTALPSQTRQALAAFWPARPGRKTTVLSGVALVDAVERALESTGIQCILIDDFHWADDPSFAVLISLFSRRSMAWIVALRDDAAPIAVGTWLAGLPQTAALRHELAPLSQADMVQLLQTLALPGCGLEALDMASRLYAHAGGNPLCLLETLRALAVQRPATVPAGIDAPIAWPVTERQRLWMVERLACLPAAARQLLHVIVCAGSDFSMDLAAAVTGTPPLALALPLSQLEDAGVFVGGRWAHEVARRVCDQEVPQPLRLWIHRRVADHLAGGPQADPAQVARHAERAEEWLRAARHYRAAAGVAGAAGRAAHALQLLGRALQCLGHLPEAPDASEVLIEQAVLAVQALPPDQSLPMAERALAAAQDDRQRMLAWRQVAGCHAHAARFDLARSAAQSSLDHGLRSRDADGTAHARYALAMASIPSEGVAKPMAAMRELRAWARHHRDPSLRWRFFADLAILYLQADRRRHGVRLLRVAAPALDALGEAGSAASARMLLGRHELLLGQAARAVATLESAVKQRARASDGGDAAGLETLNLARAALVTGRYAWVVATLEPLVERLQGPAAAVTRQAVLQVLAQAFACVGQRAQALYLCRQVAPEAPFFQRAAALWIEAGCTDNRLTRLKGLRRARACFESQDWPLVRLPIDIDLCATAGEPRLCEQLSALIEDCRLRELPALALSARAYLCIALADEGQTERAGMAVRGLLQDLERTQPVDAYLPDLLLRMSRAAAAIGNTALASACRAQGRRWLQARMADDLMPHWQESFAHRHATNSALLTGAVEAG